MTVSELAFMEYRPISLSVGRYIARRYAGVLRMAACDWEDVDQIAQIGLLYALDKFDASKTVNKEAALRAMVRNYVFDYLRAIHAVPRSSKANIKCTSLFEVAIDSRALENIAGVTPDYVREITRARLRDMRGQLGAKRRVVFDALLRDDTMRQAAKELGVSDVRASQFKRDVVCQLRQLFQTRKAAA